MAASGGPFGSKLNSKISDKGDKLSTTTMTTDSSKSESNTAGFDHLVSEVETSEGSVANVLRAVYESDEPKKFMERLDQRIKSHDKEIERMCNFHYQGFIESIKELLQVRSNAEKLQKEIVSVNTALQSSGKSLMDQGEELIRCHKIQKNIAASVEGLTLCLPVLETYSKLKEQVKNKRYYPALKTLEQLEHTYLPRVNKYQFSQTMADHIPRLRESIKDASMSDLKDFLENIRKHSVKIGEVAMKHQTSQGIDDVMHAVVCFDYEKLFERDWKFNSRRTSTKPPKAAEQNNMDATLASSQSKTKRRAPPPPNPFTGQVEDDSALRPRVGEDEEVSAQDVVDFSPVYRCLHINSVLGERETFENYYRKQRRKQARLALQPPPNMHESVEGYRKYLHEIIGFFVVEDHILNTTTGLVNRAYIDELWDMALGKVVAMLRTNSAVCVDPQLMLELKSLIVLFSHTLRGYGFAVSSLNELLLEVRNQYTETLMRKWVSIFNEIFDDDNYTPICVENEMEYTNVMDVYPFNDPTLDKASFPKRFPFSQFVPKVYTQVKQYIYACLKFTDDLHLSQTDIDDMVRKSANVLLTRALSGCLSSLIKRQNLGLLQLIQISINMNYLEQSCGYLEDFITNITGDTDKDSVHVARLHGTAMFKDARSEAEEQICNQLNLKIDQFLSLAEYDWTMNESPGHASSFILDLLTFLRSVFLSFTNLPPKVAQKACMSACSHIAKSLQELVLDNDVKIVSMGALQQINLDLMQCEVFAASEPVPGMADNILLLAFTDLRQLVDVSMMNDWVAYLADYGQERNKYGRVQPAAAINLLEKIRDYDKKKILFALKKDEKDKRRRMDLVLKQLRGLSNGNHT